MKDIELLERHCMPKLDFQYLRETVLKYMTHPLDWILQKSSQHSDTNIFLSFWNMMSDALWHSQPITDKNDKKELANPPRHTVFCFKDRGSFSDLVFCRVPSSLLNFMLTGCLVIFWNSQKF